MIRLLLVLAVWVCLIQAAGAQDYPSFVYTESQGEPQPESPVATRAEAAVDIPAEPAATPIIREDTSFDLPPRVLVGDLASTATWTATRDRIDPRFEALRLAFISGDSSSEIRTAAGALMNDLDALVQMAPVQAPGQAESVVWFESRIQRQIQLMVQDYLDGEKDRIEQTDRLVRGTVRDLKAVLARSDREREGISGIGPGGLPPAWRSDEPELQDFAAMIVAWPTWQLADEYRLRASEYFEYFRRTRDDEVSLTDALEMSALAREIARREYEIPAASRTPFRNCALQLDVMADGLHDHLVEGRRLHARRQSRVILPVIKQLEGYLELATLEAATPKPEGTPLP